MLKTKITIDSYTEYSDLFKLIEEGDILVQFTGKIEIKWEVVEIMTDKFYAVDNDGFGFLFDHNELNSNWKLNQKKNDNKQRTDNSIIRPL